MKVGRNDPCPCGSGKKYKHCCYAKDSVKKPAEAASDVEASVDAEGADAGDAADEAGAEGDHAQDHRSAPDTGKKHGHGGRRGFHGGKGAGGKAYNPRPFRGSQRGN